MAGEQIKGIGVKVTADASEIKNAFNTAVKGLENKTLQMKLSVVKDASVDRVLKEIRQTRVSVDVALHPTRDTIRTIRRDFKDAMAREGGLPVPISIKAITQAEGKRIRQAIVDSIGTPEITVILNPQWAGGGSAAGIFGGHGGTPGGSVAGGPARAAAPPSAPRTAAGVRSGVSTRLASFQRQADEAQTEWENRLLNSRVVLLQRANTANKQQTRTKAAKALAEIDKQLGAMPFVSVIGAPRTAGGTATSTAEAPTRPNRGGLISPNVGLPTGPTDWEKVARIFYQNVSRRQLSTPAFVGGEFPQEGLDQGTGRFRGLNGRFISRTAYQENRRGRDRGQRTQMSFLQPGLDLTPEEIEGRRAARVERVAAGRTASPMDELVRTIKGLPFTFGDAFEQGLAALKKGDVAGALGRHVGPGEAGSGIRGALDQLLARGRAGLIPGVGPRTVSNALDPTKEIRPGPHAEAQAAFVLEAQVLQSLQGAIMEGQTQATAAARPRRPRRGQRQRVARDVARAAALGPAEPMPWAAGAPEAPAEVAAAPAGQVFEFPHLAVAGAVEGGGGGGGIPFFGGHGGGPVPVEVMNWPGGFEQGGSVAAAGVQPTSKDFERMFQQAREDVQEAAQKLGVTPPGGGKKQPATPKARLAGTPRTEALRAIQAGTLTPEQAEGILNPPLAAEPTGLDRARQAVEEQLAQARQGLPIRGFATSVAQLAAGGGRGKITARFQRAGELLTQAGGFATDTERLNKLQSINAAQLDNINAKKEKGGKLTKVEKGLLTSLVEDQKEIGKRIASNEEAQQGLVNQASQLARLTGGEKLANLGKSLVGSIGGTLAFGTALGAVAGASALAFKALSPLVERSLGYQNVSAAITNNLAEQQKQQGGNVKMLVEQELATKNLTRANAALLAPALQRRAETQAGALAIQGRTEETAAAVNIQNAESGNLGPRGGGRTRFSTNPDIYTSSGGLFNTSLFAPVQSTQEAIARQLDLAGQGLGTAPPGPGETALRSPIETQIRALLEPIFGPEKGPAGTPGFKPNVTAFQTFQNDVKAAGLGLRAVKDRGADLDKTFAALQAADLQEFANAAKNSGIALQGLTGDVKKDAVAVTVLTEQLGKAAARRTPEQIIAGQQDQLRGIRAGINADLGLQLRTFLPAQRALSSLAQPQAAFGRGVVPLNNLADRLPFGGLPQTIRGELNVPGQVTGIGGQFKGVPPEAIASFSRYRSEAQAAIDAVNAKAAEGEKVLRDTLHVPQGTINELRGFGQRIDQISQKQANLQLDLQYSQYNHQLFIAKRTLGDIAGLIGRSGGTEIGVLQRVDLLLGRQNQKLAFKSQLIGQQAQSLQFELQQRQINFQRSVAGFTAPGVTPEERAARIEEAKIEADYSQKQLDFQKQQFDLAKQQYELSKKQFENQVALQDALNTRAFTDQAAAIAEMVKAFQTQVEVAALEELKSAIAAQRDQLVADISAQASAEEQYLKAEAQFATDLMTQTGQFTVGIVNQVKKVFDEIRASVPWFFGGGGGGGGGGSGIPGDTSAKQREGGHAAGMLGEVTQPTSLGYAGEAGKELVAVIRNPRPYPVGMGTSGGGASGSFSPIYITISGNSVRDDRDLDELATRVGRIVETNMGRRASQFGFRTTR